MSAPYSAPTLRQRITRLAIVPITLVTLLVLALLSINHLHNERAHIDQLSTTLVDLMVKKISVAVFLSDERSSTGVLDSLSSVPAVLFADAGNRRTGFFVQYEKDGLDADTRRAVSRVVEGSPSDGLLPRMRRESRVIRVDGETIGDFTMVLDTSSLGRSLTGLAYVGLLAVLLAVILGVLLNRLLTRQLLMPVLRLQEAMNRFSGSGRLDEPLARTGQREVDELYDGFEHMAREIEDRDVRLQRHREHLEEEVRVRSEELVDLNRRRMEWLERIAHFLKHELDNKILGIATTLDLIERNDEQRRFSAYVDRGRRTATQMHRLLRDVAETTSLEAALAAEDKKTLDLSALIQAQVAEYAQIYPAIRFASDIAPSLRVHGNADRLIQLLDKLIANAVEHVAPGAVIGVSLARQGDDVILAVENAGNPLPADRRQLFELSYSTAASGDPGRGMGLYVVQLVAADHHGQAWAEPVRGGTGARLLVRLPAQGVAGVPEIDEQASRAARAGDARR